jgi:hypothetical protein
MNNIVKEVIIHNKCKIVLYSIKDKYNVTFLPIDSIITEIEPHRGWNDTKGRYEYKVYPLPKAMKRFDEMIQLANIVEFKIENNDNRNKW